MGTFPDQELEMGLGEGAYGQRPGAEDSWEPRVRGQQRDGACQGGLELRQKGTEPPAEAQRGEALSLWTLSGIL